MRRDIDLADKVRNRVHFITPWGSNTEYQIDLRLAIVLLTAWMSAFI